MVMVSVVVVLGSSTTLAWILVESSYTQAVVWGVMYATEMHACGHKKGFVRLDLGISSRDQLCR